MGKKPRSYSKPQMCNILYDKTVKKYGILYSDGWGKYEPNLLQSELTLIQNFEHNIVNINSLEQIDQSKLNKDYFLFLS